ncbi:Plant regulator RWP-RK family protein putative isoform 1 [Tripterygium wilfordii]|uniref:Plant regulator RWP-RK family protein putative isoform 1 n=1 Tax=Tripterygium wilfordii TaxID=458696 RepID=A0A7J7DXF7_TRIWF|nr:protein NLP2-like [Tripterygium wilfordii]XP_038721622.1 protein NLP2-like [Tripterygium wilfordii]KAF5751007.1 Plant regulator RWP-RK family protein putative isoform 1 [Tripterygium wilfordii]
MEDGAFTGSAVDLDFMEELFSEGCWLETTDAFNFLQPNSSTSGAPSDPMQFMPPLQSGTSHFILNPIQQEETGKGLSEDPPLVSPQIEELVKADTQNQNNARTTISSGQSEAFLIDDTEVNRRWWIGPNDYPGPSSSVKDRLMQVIGYLKNLTKDRNVLIQIWVPIKKEGKHVLTTKDQPYSLDLNCKDLESYRSVSNSYHFAAEVDSKDLYGLPGRVFVGKLPEWTPDVRFFRSEEYPRVYYAQQYNVCGSLALPVFERGSGTCLGVIEIVTTTQNIDYRPDLESVCKALEAVDLQSTQDFSHPSSKACNDLYQAAVPELLEILGYVCKTHRLPLALTWAPCSAHGEGGGWHSDENYAYCVSTVDSACFVADQELLGFHVACSEHHLFRGRGIVGRAFATRKQCFATDVTAFRQTEYPLSHHAKVFQLCAAVAIPVQSIYSASAEFVLEFFLPKDCQDVEDQQRIVSSLPSAIQQACQSLCVVMDDDVEVVNTFPIKEIALFSDQKVKKEENQTCISSSSKEPSMEESSWISCMIDAQQKGKSVSVSWESQKEPNEGFKVTTYWDDSHEELHHKQAFPHLQQFPETKRCVEGGGDSSTAGGPGNQGSRRAVERRRSKSEKTISLQVLRQYFSGTLKDAAKSIGVCPTTLKRICRQHGITRWPSRKINKVGHSLRKLQLVIDSVQGGIQIGSFYSSFPELNFSENHPCSSVNATDQSNPPPETAVIDPGAAVSNSHSSSCSHSSGLSCSTGAKELTAAKVASGGRDAIAEAGGVLKRARSDVELFSLSVEEPKLLARSQSQKTFGEHAILESLPPSPKSSGHNFAGTFRVKATFGEERVRFSLQPNWSFMDLRQEIVRRFNLADVDSIRLKYLDDDSEWVLLTCDADLEECIDIYRLSQSRTIKISVHYASQPILGSSFQRTVPP